MRQTFTLVSPTKADFDIQFKQHLVIPQKAKLQVNFVQIRVLPYANYLQQSYAILTDLPIKTFYASSVGAKLNKAVQNNLLVYVPLTNQAFQDLDDPPALATAGGFTYEPHQPLIHEIDGNELQLNSMNFKFVDGDTLISVPETDFIDITVSFTIFTDE
jgi:hypothetical protein